VTPHNNTCESATDVGVDGNWAPTGFDGFQMAAFYVAQGPNWVWGASGGWTDGSYCWRKEYNLQCGHPLDDANRTGPYTWTRNFTGCDVYLNTDCTGECFAAHPNASQGGLYGEIILKNGVKI
jgi:hypothetical protein